MVNFKVVIEGGGTGPALRADMAKGFQKFFTKANPGSPRPQVIRGGGRTQTLAKFNAAWESRKPGDIVLLLIDSEEPVKKGTSKIKHLASRDGWKDKPPDITEADVFLMVCVMEAWICADRDALKLFYGGGFDETKLPAVGHLETVPRATLYEALEKATKQCKEKQPYSKGDHSFALIGLIDPAKLDPLPHAKEFMDHLKAKLQPTP